MNKLFDYLCRFYSPEEFPALAAQITRWRESRPLSGRHILDATPVFRNTMVKYCALLAAGAELTVAAGENLPCDPEVCRMLPEFGIRFAGESELAETYDAVADCAGNMRHCRSRYGFVELTRSGLEYYRNCPQPVFSADSGVLKELETILGTGEGFLRAMKQLGYDDFTNRDVLIFGGGKVGCGVARYAGAAGAKVAIADLRQIVPPPGVSLIDGNDTVAVNAAIDRAWCIVSVTGIAGALDRWSARLNASSAVIANMGVEDEFGPELPASRVLNEKRPLNFILEEPTHLKYIDATMALNNCGIIKLLAGGLGPGINTPERELERKITADIRRTGCIAAEMEFITSRLD